MEAYVAYLGSGGYALRVGPEAIRQLPQPTLVVWGEDDPVLPPSDARKFERDLPHCERVAMIAGGGHCPQLLQADALVEELASFLSRLLSPYLAALAHSVFMESRGVHWHSSV